MEVLSTVFIFIISIIILVACHEYGHFIVARLNQVKVLEFAIGFGKTLASYKGIKGTNYSVKLFPLGGYVKMLDSRELSVGAKDRKSDFNLKHPLQKISIVIAGPLFNFILAIFCFFLMYQVGVLEHEPTIFGIEINSVASKAGMNFNFNDPNKKVKINKVNQIKTESLEDVQIVLAEQVGNENQRYMNIAVLDNGVSRDYNLDLSLINFYKNTDLHTVLLTKPLGINLIPNKIAINQVLNKNFLDNGILKKGDLILGIKNKNKNKNKNYDMFEILDYIKNNPNTEVELKVYRGNKIHNVNLQIGEKDNKGYLGILFDMPFDFELKKYSIKDSLVQSFRDTCKYIEKSFTMTFKIVLGELGLENVHGPIMVAKAADKSWRLGFSQFLKFLGIISIGLGVINLLPIPLLDGGHVVYHIVEWINPKWITKVMEEAWLKLGVSFIIMMFFLAVYNDIKYW